LAHHLYGIVRILEIILPDDHLADTYFGDDNVLTKLFDIRGEGGEINNPLSSKDVSDTAFGN
jgi:hypothetical protein